MGIADRGDVYEDFMLTAESDVLAIKKSWQARYPTRAVAAVNSWHYQYIKRALDLICALIMIVAFVIPGLVIAAAIVMDSDGPVFYREQRIGRDGRLFRIWKFRSMRRSSRECERIESPRGDGELPQFRMNKNIADPRITSVGRFVRTWSLDELPQLVNVLRGEMSLVGPRPIIEAEAGYYGDLLPFYLAATPGLSGLWQVSGRSEVGYEKRARLDALYVSSWSLIADLEIFIRTVPAVLSRAGAR